MDPVALLNRRYPTRTAARALWHWSGGEPASIDSLAEGGDIWAQLWPLAETHDDGVSLLREVLFDRPGDPDVIELLAGVAAQLVPAALERAPDAAADLKALAPGFAPEAVRALLRALPALTWHDAFTSLTPVCEAWLSRPDRERLAETCSAIAARDASLANVLALRRAGLPSADARPLIARLHDHAARSDDPWCRALTRALGELPRTAPDDATPAQFAESLDALLRLPEAAAACGDPARVAALAEGLRAAIWGTHAEYAADPDDAGDAGDAIDDLAATIRVDPS